MSQIDSMDARQETRTDALVGATIERTGKPDLRCLITNISDEGAELKLESDQRVPPRFNLHVPHRSTSYRAEVRWRDEGRVGVVFHGATARSGPALKLV